MDLNAVVEGRGRESYQALRAFLRSAGGRLFGSVSADRLDECYESFKDELARFARTLGLEERFQLYKDVRNLTVRIPENPVAVSCEYTLEKSFLTQDEINILILKLIHEPISQRELAESKLLCSRQAVSTRIQDIKDGARIGAASVKLDLKNTHKVSSTAHPISLVLNLSEVYALISALQESAAQREPGDPRAVIQQSLAEMVYYQLSNYAKEQICPRLQQAGIRMQGNVPPCFEGNALSGPRDSAPTERQRLSNWLYYEKSGRRARIVLAGADQGEQQLEGRIVPGAVPPELLAKLPNANPASCFCLELADGSLRVLSWGNVVEVSAAGQGERFDEGDRADRADRS